jgi:transposase
MPAEQAPPVQSSLSDELVPLQGRPFGRGLTLLGQDGSAAVALGGRIIYAFDQGDRAGMHVTVASLAQHGWATETELAEVFGCHRNTVIRLRRQLQAGSLGALVPAKPGPKGAHKVTDAVRAILKDAAARGQGPAEVRQRIAAEAGVHLSYHYVWQLLKAEPAQPEQLVLGSEESVDGGKPEGAADSDSSTVMAQEAKQGADSQPEAREIGEPPVVLPQGRGRYLGAALFLPALWALGLLDAAAQCFRLPRSERFGVRAVTLTVFFLTVLGKSTLEAAKHLRRWEFGPLVGAGRAPSVKTLRRKFKELIGQGRALHFQQLLARHWVAQGLIATAYLCVDGHVHVYTGKRKLQQVWDSKRRLPLPGVLHYFVNDLQGRPLLFVSEQAGASLAQVMPKVVAAVREAVAGRQFTLIFDRGGYDGKLFAWLQQEGIPFITYQRGEPDLPLSAFRSRRARFEGRRVHLQIAEDQVRVGGQGPWRRIVVRTPDGHQTPILTSLSAGMPAARIACLMFLRWRQENFFKYSREHHGLDQILGYAWAEADGQRLVANPERKALSRALAEKRAHLRQLRSELGQVVLDEPRDSGRTVHGLKVSQHGAVGRLRDLEAEIQDLLDRRAALPERIPLKDTGPREVLRLEQKAIIDRIKITAYNAEEWLLERLLPHYPHPEDIRGLLRFFAELSGEINTTADGVVVTLDPPDIPAQRRALRGLCADLSVLRAPFPGTDLPVIYRVGVHHSEVAG